MWFRTCTYKIDDLKGYLFKHVFSCSSISELDFIKKIVERILRKQKLHQRIEIVLRRLRCVFSFAFWNTCRCSSFFSSIIRHCGWIFIEGSIKSNWCASLISLLEPKVHQGYIRSSSYNNINQYHPSPCKFRSLTYTWVYLLTRD